VSYTTETSAGVVTVRAFKMMDRFFKNFQHLVDTDAALFLHTNAALEWLQSRMDILQNLILFTAACLFVFLPMGSIIPGNTKIMIYYSTFYAHLWSLVLVPNSTFG